LSILAAPVQRRDAALQRFQSHSTVKEKSLQNSVTIHEEEISDQYFPDCDGHLERQHTTVPARSVPVILELSIKSDIEAHAVGLDGLEGRYHIGNTAGFLDIQRCQKGFL